MRWVLIILLMCNGIYFLWQNYLVQNDNVEPAPINGSFGEASESLSLLSEIASDSDGLGIEEADLSEVALVSSSKANTQQAKESGLQPQESPDLCLLIGPFKEEVSAKQMVGRLASLDIVVELRPIELQGKPDYWVHLPPQVTRKDAIKLLRELQVKKIDSFLITEGELENGISLGFFTEKARAEAVFEQRLKQGYEPVIKIVPRTSIEVWALLNRNEYPKFSDALWDTIKQGNQGLERRKNYCDKIASVDNFD